MRGIWLVAFALSLSACQCVQLPADLKCTPDQCAPDRCGDDGRCHGVSDAGCVASTSCALAGLECGLLDTGCGEEACGTCNAGSTCGTFQPGQCAPCDPDVFDFPDPNFVDSNCDGIDGTVDGGLFVDPVIGSDGPFGTGQRDAPLRSLGRAQAVISRRSGDPIHTVFIAEGFLDGLTWDQPVSLAGGYRAITWARSALAVTTIQRQDVGLRLEGLPATVLVTGLTIEGLTSSTPGIATVGLWVFDSPVSLRTLVVRAQGGAAGADGAPGLPGTPGGDGAAGPQGESGPLGCGRFCTSASAGLPADGGAGACGPGGEGAASPNISMATIRPVDDLFASVLGCGACPCPAADGGFELRRGADADGGSAGLDGDAGLPSASLTVAVGQVDGGWWSPTAPPPPGTDGLNGVGGTGGLAGGSAIYQEGTSYSQVAFGSVGGGGGAPGCGGRGGQSGAPGGAEHRPHRLWRVTVVPRREHHHGQGRTRRKRGRRWRGWSRRKWRARWQDLPGHLRRHLNGPLLHAAPSFAWPDGRPILRGRWRAWRPWWQWGPRRRRRARRGWPEHRGVV